MGAGEERLRVLVIDDDVVMRTYLLKHLERLDCEVSEVGDGAEGLRRIQRGGLDLVFLDYRLPGMDGLEVLQRLREAQHRVEVVMVTAFASVEHAVAAMREGAADYLTKPFEAHRIEQVVLRARESLRKEAEIARLRRQVRDKYDFENIVGTSEGIRNIRELILKAARSDSTVVVQGESGTGKELVAEAIHYHSQRAGGPFVPIDCSAINANLIESELFGHIKGAFTGADSDHVGLFKAAHGGTLFLDELSEIVFEIQAKLLRVIQERTIKPVGATQALRVDVRIVAATHRDLFQQIEQGEFREDLFYRLNVISISLPPLRRRREDVPLLTRHFIRKYSNGVRELQDIAPAALEALRRYDWPGNVRELENVVQRALALGVGPRLGLEDLPAAVQTGRGEGVSGEAPPLGTLEEMERRAIVEALRVAGGRKEEAARILGIDRSTLYRKIRRYGLS